MNRWKGKRKIALVRWREIVTLFSIVSAVRSFFFRIETNSITGNAIDPLACNRGKHIEHLYAFVGDTRGNECPEDSVQGEGGECKCIDCPPVECESGQRRIQVKPADPETPGSCCARYDCLPSGKRSN